MKKRLYAISLLLSSLIVLIHQMIPHHHSDSMATVFTHTYLEVEEHHHQNSHENSNDEEDSETKNNHPFSNHHHISATEDFDCTRTNTQQTYLNIQSKNIFVGLFLIHKQYIEAPKLTEYSFGDPPILISSLFEPAAIALRGPPSIA